MGGGQALPTGPVTFLFTDIEGSTRLAHELGDAWVTTLGTHDRLVREVVAAQGGIEVSTAGDSFFVVFASPQSAIAAAVAIHRAMAAQDWDPQPVRVRIGMHTGEAAVHLDNYAGLAVHVAARVEAAAAGGQALATEATLLAAAGSGLPEGVSTIDLGPHRLKDLPTAVRVFQLTAPGLAREFPPVRSLEILRNNVPVPASSFVGRAVSLAHLHRLLDRERLVTLVGPGGAGKTRLSIELARERLNRYRDGVWFVAVEPAHDADSVAAAFADALQVSEAPGRALVDVLAESAAALDLLLVVDNCEHVIDEVARITERLVEAGRGVHVLATSREPLAIAGETEWPIPPLTVDGDPAESEAVQLLADRIGRVRPGFELDMESAAQAGRIARSLDGLPLALELAAAAARMLSLEEIEQQLEHRFALLVRGSRTAGDRQRTLWGAIDWSYDLLPDGERSLLRALGVFPSEFDLEAAAGVWGEDHDAAARALGEMVTKSMVVATAAGRYRLLESIRAYAREQSRQAGEYDGHAERHARWFGDRLLASETNMQPDALDALEAAYNDVVAGAQWAAAHDGEFALSMMTPFERLVVRTGRLTQGRHVIERIVDANRNFRVIARSKATEALATLNLRQGDIAGARRYFEMVVEFERDLSREDVALAALGNLAIVAARVGDHDEAERLLTEAIDAIERIGSEAQKAIALVHFTELAHRRGDLDLARTRGASARDAALRAGDVALVIACDIRLGSIAQESGDLPVARHHLEQALSTAGESADEGNTLYLLFCLAALHLEEGQQDAAASLLARAVRLGDETAAHADLAESLEATARLAASRDDWDLATRLMAGVDRLRAELEFARSPDEEARRVALIAELESASPDFPGQWARGGAAVLDELIDEALSFLDSQSPAPVDTSSFDTPEL